MENAAEIYFPDLLFWAIPIYSLGMLAEFIWLRYKPIEGAIAVKDSTVSIIMGMGMLVTDLLFKGLFLVFLMWVWQFHIFDFGVSWLGFIITFILVDIAMYGVHRLSHSCRWFWANHVVHHSTEHFNLSAALRQPLTNYFSGTLFLYAPLALLGIHPVLLLFVFGINTLYQFWIHTETIGRLPKWFEFVFNTASHHRVHHARNPRYLDANYAAVLIVWDRMFGTFVPELDEDKPEYGLVSQLGSYNLIIVAFHEWIDLCKDCFQKNISLKQRLLFAFAAPGTCFDGSRMTSEQIKADYVARHPKQSGTHGLPK